MTNLTPNASASYDWDTTPRPFPSELALKPERAQGQTPVVEGHVLNKAVKFDEAAAEAFAALTVQVVPTPEA